MPEKELDNLSPSQRALLAIRELRSRLEAVERERTKPIAIIGIGCRFPGGAHDPESFWRLLQNGVDAIREVPPERWDLEEYYDPDPEAPGKMYCRHGSFLDGLDKFDARFFGISPREAMSLDPQQRLLLETTWEAFEHAGLAPDKLNGSATGVFVGISTNDYGQMHAKAGAPEEIDSHSATGNALSIASGRLSYFFGLHGPNLAVDTACSSSLVTVHLACQALRNGECRLAVAGGVSVILAPEITINLCKAHMLAADGRCKSFDAAADGYVRGEGCGMVVLKRLRDAVADGDNILAVIRSSAVNQDGRSNGLTAPNGRAQVAVMQRALELAGVAPAQVDYLEAHGTGTALGDPIEMRSIVEVMAPGRSADHPLYVGSVKTNLGHLEPAAGIAALIKTVLALQHEAIPPHLHFKSLNPHIALADAPIVIAAQGRPWPRAEKPRLATVNAFGFSGTNAHVVLEEAPLPQDKPAAAPPPDLHVLTLSAKNEAALLALADRYAAHCANQPEQALADLCYTSHVGRAHFEHRLAVVADSPSAAAAQLAALAAGKPAGSLVQGRVKSATPPSLAFLFSGNNALPIGIGRQLYESQPVFRVALEKCDTLLRPHLDKPLLSILFNEKSSVNSDQSSVGSDQSSVPTAHRSLPTDHWLYQATYAQPALFALEYALAELWRSWGIAPALVIGHKTGEYVAACIAGVFSLADGLQLAVAAGRVRQARRSPLVEPLLASFEATARAIAYQAPEVTWISTLTGKPFDGAEIPDADYWCRHLRAAVRFADSLRSAHELGCRHFLEIGPRPILTRRGRALLPQNDIRRVTSCGRGRSEQRHLLTALATLYVNGASIAWENLDQRAARRRVTLPTYAFQRERYWIDRPTAKREQPENWFYEIEWQNQPLVQSNRNAHSPAGWLIFADRSHVGAALAKRLQEQGQPWTLVAHGPGFRRVDERNFIINPLHAEDFERVLAAAWPAQATGTLAIVHLWSLDAPPTDQFNAAAFDYTNALTWGSVLTLTQKLAGRTGAEQAKLWLVTRGAQAVELNGQTLRLSPAPLFGMARALRPELPELWGGMIDLDFVASERDAATLLAAITHADGEDEVAFRHGVRYVPRLVSGTTGAGSAGGWAEGGAASPGTIVITGGLGSLGLQVAQWLAGRGAQQLVLVSRRPPAPETQEVVKQLESRGVKVMVARCDVADEVQLAMLFDEINHELPPLRGVVHAAGLLADGLILQQDWSRFSEVLAPKVRGAWNLHVLTAGMPLDFFVLFSSAAALLPAAGQANYAAANAFMDQLAHYRRACGLPALSINWGPWSAAGMAAAVGTQHARQRSAAGLQSLTPQQGLHALARLFSHSSAAQVAVLRMDWQKLGRQFTHRLPPLLSELAALPPAATSGAGAPRKPIEQFKALPPEQRTGFMAEYLRSTIGRILGMAPAEITPERTIFELGLDSLMAMELANYLQRDFGYKPSVREVHRRPTIGAIIDYLTLTLNQREGLSSGSTNPPDHSLAGLLRPQRAISFPPVTQRNPSMIFLLSCPRSGSTLFRVMLAGHPRLFAPPELHLLLFGTMGEWHAALRLTVLGEGLQRAFMELQQISAEESKALIAELVAKNVTTQQVYAMLQELAYPRILVDKSPTYVADFEALRRAEEMFEQPRYLFLHRHPYAVIESYLRNEMGNLSVELGGDRQLDAELVWANGNSNALELGELAGPGRFQFVRYEEMVAEPERITAGICEFLGLEYSAALVNPYAGSRMTDGLSGQALAIGDPNFSKRSKIDKELGEAWRQVRLERRLCSFARRVAKELQYELPENFAPVVTAPEVTPPEEPPLQPVPRTEAMPLSFAQQRLWFLEQFEPGNPMYNIPLTLRLRGELQVAALESAWQEIVRRHESLRTTFTAVAGEPVQHIAASRQIPLVITDLQALPEAQREAEAQRLGRERVRAPFDFVNGPLIRCELFRLRPDEHLLLLPMHHIISDGWSLGIITRELGALYSAFVQGQPSPLPELELHYVDYAVWQRNWLQGETLAQQIAYWRSALGDNPAPLQLPTDRPRPAVLTPNGDRVCFSWPRELAEQARQLSRTHQVTPFMTLLAAFKVLLQRYSGAPDIIVGSPIANRNHPGIANIIGFFVNTLVLRTNLDGDPTFAEVLQRVREVTLNAYNNQDVPFEKLVEALHVERDPSRSPLFQVMFVLQNLDLELPEMAGLSVSSADIDSATAKFDLRFSLFDRADGLSGDLEFNTDLFETATIARLLTHYRNVLEAVVRNPGLRLSEVPLLAEEERRKMLVEWNNTGAAFPQEHCIHHWFEAQVEKTPEAVAVTFGAQTLSYAELNCRANRVAHHLQSLGVGPEVLVGIYVERSLEMVIGLLGILKAGGAYVPLDPNFPTERLALMLEDSAAPVLLTQEKLLATLPPHQAQVVCLESLFKENGRHNGASAAARADNPVSHVGPPHLAYVLFTSGSTGRPKGVQIEHRSVVNFLSSMAQEPGFTSNDVLLAVTTLSFDIAGLELYLPLVQGGRLVLAGAETAADGAALLRLLHESQATVMQATPATWRLLLAAGWNDTSNLKILCGGEALPAELAQDLLARCASLWNMYGPTETTIWSSLLAVEAAQGIVPIGRPIANTDMYIVDAHLNPVPLGVPGELLIGGAGLSRGYLKRPELTAEKFIPHPFSAAQDARLYRTGDLCRYRPEGVIEFLGRLDHQVKVRGFRIELGDIETALAQHPAVQAVVVMARADASGENRLVAYLIAAGDAPAVSELRAFLQERLPEYMIPSAFVLLESFPLTPNGKVDRRALPEPEMRRSEAAAAFVAPRTAVEAQVAAIWREVLRLEQIGVHDGFFELGGHSLLATQVVSRIQNVMQINLPVRTLFEAKTVAELADRIETIRWASRSESEAPEELLGEREEIEI